MYSSNNRQELEDNLLHPKTAEDQQAAQLREWNAMMQDAQQRAQALADQGTRVEHHSAGCSAMGTGTG
jgi:hypothetical protein